MLLSQRYSDFPVCKPEQCPVEGTQEIAHRSRTRYRYNVYWVYPSGGSPRPSHTMERPPVPQRSTIECFFNTSFRENANPHASQTNGFSRVCTVMCSMRRDRHCTRFSQYWHANILSAFFRVSMTTLYAIGALHRKKSRLPAASLWRFKINAFGEPETEKCMW